MDFVQQMAAAGAVLALLAATLWWLRRKGFAGVLPARRTAGRRLECLERLALGPQHTLHLVRLGETALLLASTPAGCTLVESIPHRQIEDSREAGRVRPLRALAVLLAALPALAAPAEPLSLLGISAGKNGASVSAPMQIVILLTLMTLLPAAVMSVTPFLRITVVLHFLRQALGTQSTPSNQVLLGLALFLTIIVMQPVAADMYHQGWEPMESGQLTPQQAMDQGTKPLRHFLTRFAREKDIRLFVEMTHRPAPHSPDDLDLTVLMPAYILSELKTGFQIGAVLFLPFLVIDLVVASVTLSVGMVQLPPVMVSAPFKILLFVLADGWNLVVGSLMKSFY